jgi:hypothetical protein
MDAKGLSENMSLKQLLAECIPYIDYKPLKEKVIYASKEGNEQQNYFCQYQD